MLKMYFGRHIAFLGVAAGLIVLYSILRGSPSDNDIWLWQFPVYGALHGGALVAALKQHASKSRRSLFVIGAAAAGLLAPLAGLYMTGVIAVFTGPIPSYGPLLILALGSGFGASTYVLLVRAAFADRLGLRSGTLIVIICIMATLFATVLRAPESWPYLWLTVFWWFAASGSFWIVSRSTNVASGTFATES
jgi:hypothetical protein